MGNTVNRELHKDNINCFLDRIFDKYSFIIDQKVEAFQKENKYIRKTKFKQHILFKDSFIKLLALNKNEYVLMYQFQPNLDWLSICSFYKS